MSENLTRFESERQRQDRRAAEHIKRAKQVERNRVEWCNRMYHAALAGNYDVARHILDTQLEA